MEDIVLTKMREFVGWDDGDGIFSPGQSHVRLRDTCEFRQPAVGVVGPTH